MNDPFKVFNELKSQFLNYYDTPFGLADDGLMNERKSLLDVDGGLYRDPVLEIRPNYKHAPISLVETLVAQGLDEDEASFLTLGLLPKNAKLYCHQQEALAQSSKSVHLVLTPGTGSGKTESFLLPIITQLLKESKGWSESDKTLSSWWKKPAGLFEPSRKKVHSRTAAVRSLILYPMNALVDDQLVRLRKALDSDDVCAWLDNHRAGSRFYFGRYTGATPVSGVRDNKSSRTTLRTLLRTASDLFDEVSSESEDRYFVQRPYSSEMISRWDMLDFPPDILITNYSMLNVMMQRSDEEVLFESTRSWLDEDESNIFTLVMDEMHAYRGTSGSEVAFIVRNLIHRLGLYNRPNQLRIIASSASLEPNRDENFLADFFGLKSDSFTFISGEIERIHKSPSSTNRQLTPAEVILEKSDEELGEIIESLFYEPDSSSLPQVLTFSEISDSLFPNDDTETATEYLAKILARMTTDLNGHFPKLRSHMFFRNVPGIWACCDSSCPDVKDKYTSGGRTVGKLYLNPTPTCTCGSRVLELLYCQGCGHVLLGGYTLRNDCEQSARALDLTLLPDLPDLQSVPDGAGAGRNAENYRVYWPHSEKPIALVGKATVSEKIKYEFKKVKLYPEAGRLTSLKKNENPDGWILDITVPIGRSESTVSPFPIACPHCADDWRIHLKKDPKAKTLNSLAMRSSTRAMRTGFEKVNQVLITSLMRDLPENRRKCVVFTDSRQDAAKLSSGIALSHYYDVIRNLLSKQLQVGTFDMQLIYDAKSALVDHDFELDNRLTEFKNKWPNEWKPLAKAWTSDDKSTSDRLIAALDRPSTLQEIAKDIFKEMLRLGMNPAGPQADIQFTKTQHLEDGRDPEAWHRIYDWKSEAPFERIDLDSVLRNLRDSLHERSEIEVIKSFVSGSGRDFESIGLGWIDLATSDNNDGDISFREVAQGSLRVLAQKQRFLGLRDGYDSVPGYLKRYWEKVAAAAGCSYDHVEEEISKHWGDAVREYLILPNRVYLRRAPERVYVCSICSRQHAVRGFGICTSCHGNLSELTEANQKSNTDYYASNALRPNGAFGLRSAELTGQTGAKASQLRQASFQNVFLNGEQEPRVDALEILSVTTTMEAGVDIGALDVVVMGNMPPTRFNYQQRVGRAGRRGANIALALTVCRPRSHDDHYFNNPKLIVSEPTPAPYLAMSSEKIAKRVISAEILRQAFKSSEVQALVKSDNLDLTRNTHGHFGLAEDWRIYEPYISSWVRNHELNLAEELADLLRGTALFKESMRIVDEATNELFNGASQITEKSQIGHTDLSQRLAENGFLPMFGFPTQSRRLYLGPPSKSFPWPPENSIDRDGPMALSAFAPGSELIKDGWIYKTSGVANWQPFSNRRPSAMDLPFSDQQIVNVCKRCSFLMLLDSIPATEEACPQCGAEPGIIRAVRMREPLGYYAGANESDKRPFDGNFAWTPNAMHARARANFQELDLVDETPLSVWSGSAKKFIINDNRGSGFNFEKSSSEDIFFAKEDVPDGSQLQSIALGTSQVSDFAFFGPKETTFELLGNAWSLDLSSSGSEMSPSVHRLEGKRAGWYSFAFLLREVAASYLDVQPADLGAGILSSHISGVPTTFAFIADTLENGAGFSTRVSAPEELEKFILKVDHLVSKEYESVRHLSSCRGSCYSCIRDYQNMPFHPLLDWRLAADLFALLRNESLGDYVERIVSASDAWAKGYSGELNNHDGSPFVIMAGNRGRRRVALVPHHPFESLKEGCVSPRLTRLKSFIDDSVGAETLFVDSLVLSRTPSIVMSEVANIRSR